MPDRKMHDTATNMACTRFEKCRKTSNGSGSRQVTTAPFTTKPMRAGNAQQIQRDESKAERPPAPSGAPHA